MIPGLGRSPGGGYGNPLQYSCLENPQEHRSLAGFSSCSHKEPDTTEGLSATQHMYYPIFIIIMVNHLRRAPHAHHLLLSVPEILPLPSSSLLLLLLLLPLLLRNYLDHHHHQATTPITAKTFLSGVSLIQCPRQGESSKPVLSYQPNMSC